MSHTQRDRERALARAKWQYRGRARPDFAVAPGPGEESVWDYPRPPRIALDPRRVEVRSGRLEIACSERALRVLETGSPPTFYLPLADVRGGVLEPAAGASECEWKGTAAYWSLSAPHADAAPVAWSYPSPLVDFDALSDHLAFYPGRVECRVAGERVRPQAGGFYGGWVTAEITGPWKGEPGTESW